MIHVTPNEAGRNAVLKDRVVMALDLLIKGVQNGKVNKDEIVVSLQFIKKLLIKKLKTRPTLRGGN